MFAYQQYQSDSYALSADERERLILEHMPQVQLIARRIHENTAGKRVPGRLGVERCRGLNHGDRQL